MRRLSVKQKKALKKMFEKTHDSTLVYDSEYDRISNMNPHENFDSNAQRFLSDLDAELFRNTDF